MNENILLEQLAQLTENQRNQIIREIKDYIQMNDSLKSTRPTLCPCWKKDARFNYRTKRRKLASCYDQLSEKTNCRIKHLKTNKSYNKVEHLNTVNCIHSIIKDAIKQYRGVSAKYINRYSSMFVFYRRYQGMDQNEITENVIRTIKLFFHTVRRSNISSYKTFPSLSNI